MIFFNLLKIFIITCFLFNVAFPMKSCLPQEQDYKSAQSLLNNLGEQELEQNTDKDNIINLLAHVKTQILLTFFVAMHLSFDVESPGSFTIDLWTTDRRNKFFYNPIHQITYMLDYVERVINAASIINNSDSYRDVAAFCILPLHSSSIILSIPCTDKVLPEGDLKVLNDLQLKEQGCYSFDSRNNLISFEVNEEKNCIAHHLLKMNMRYLVDLISFLKNEHYKKLKRWIKVKNVLEFFQFSPDHGEQRQWIQRVNIESFFNCYLEFKKQGMCIEVNDLRNCLKHYIYPEEKKMWMRVINSPDYLHAYSKNNVVRFLNAKKVFNISCVNVESLKFLDRLFSLAREKEEEMDFSQRYLKLYEEEHKKIKSRFY